MTRHDWPWLALAALLVVAGCERAAPPSPGPKAVLTQLIAAHAAHDHQRIVALTRRDRGAELVRTLIALDELLGANQRLVDWLQRARLPGLARAIDQSRLAYHLDVFSPKVELLDAHIDGDRAEVSFLVDSRLPARRAQLVRENGRWRYDPGPAPPGAADAFAEMAHGLRRVLGVLERGEISVAELRMRPKRLIEEVLLRLEKGVALLAPPPGDNEAGSR